MSSSLRRLMALCALVLLAASGGLPAEEESEIPAGFRYVGAYQLTKRIKIRDGDRLKVAIEPLIYHAYTDGISVRFYGAGGSGHTSFDIYRRDGIAVLRDDALLETVPGIQARSLVGDVLRQVSLTEESLTLSKFPALSDIIEITYAQRVFPGDEPRREAAAP